MADPVTTTTAAAPAAKPAAAVPAPAPAAKPAPAEPVLPASTLAEMKAGREALARHSPPQD